MNNKISAIFLCILLVVAIIIGYTVISSLNNKLNEFKEQINYASDYLPRESSGFESDPGNVEPVDENTLDK